MAPAFLLYKIKVLPFGVNGCEANDPGVQLKLIDNITSTLRDDLMTTIKSGSRISIAAASFSMYAFQELREQLNEIAELRFIFTSPSFVTEKAEKQRREFYIPRLNRERNLFGSEFEIKLRNELSLKAVARECADWIRQKACFKSNCTSENMMGFINVDETNYMPITGFTTVDLGCERGNNAYQFVQRTDAPLSQFYLNLFNEVWLDDSKLQDVTEQVLDNITTAYRENAPEFIYFVSLYNIFNEFLEDISEDVLPNEATGFRNSQIWGKLYNFQRDAALAIINKLEKYNGCILADSVGLGKTFTALSVIKYYENRNKSVLVLCPKKLYENWVAFRANYRNNPIAADRLRYDILFHSDLSRDRGKSAGGLDLDYINWGNYDLVVIDESHNFRNGGKISTNEDTGEERENRFLRLMNRVIKPGVKTKVLMLSATPVNNRFNDLKNQLSLAYEGDSENINGLLDTDNTIEDIFRMAQAVYNKWAKLDPEERTTERLLSDLSFDFFKVLDAVTIARSRKHIVKYYDTTDIGTFPDRLPPISRRPPLTDLDKNKTVTFKEIAQLLDDLNLAIYTPSLFLQPSAKDKYALKFEGNGKISVDGREKGLRKLMAINMLKRLESSVNSFRLTLERINSFIANSIAAIDNFDRNSGSGLIDVTEFSDDFDNEDSENDPFVGRKSRIDIADMDYVSWRRCLKEDHEKLSLLLAMLEPITPAHDSKLQQLYTDLSEKFSNPINPGNKKALIFTAFADTAEYLYRELAPRIKEEYGLNVALVTGNTDGRWTLSRRDVSFNNVLTFFSPRSKDRDVLYPGCSDTIDVLIATDCISEGQNLQDCDFLVNYDIHWNPVRIIQRFGRIDRIGSQNSEIQLVNYWPNVDLDEYIKLKGRVESRMKATVLTSTGDGNLLSPEEKGDLEYRRQQLKKLQTEVVDIEDMDTGINIMDLGLNEFRLDLLAYIKEHPEIERTPNGMSAVVAASEELPQGVIFILKNRRQEVNIGKTNQLHPFYMVYISTDGEVIVDHLAPKRLLDNLRMACKGKTEPLAELCRRLNAETDDGRDMSAYTELLHLAIESIVSVKEESDIASLFSDGESSFLRNEITGLDDFELITFLIVK